MSQSHLFNFLKQTFQSSAFHEETKSLTSEDPLELYKLIATPEKPSFLLEVSEGSPYAYVGIDPVLTLETNNHMTTITVIGKKFLSEEHPFALLREILSFLPKAPIIGYMAYEASSYFEKLPKPIGEPSCADFHFVLHKNSYIFDYKNHTIIHKSFHLPSSFFVPSYRCNVTSLQKENTEEQFEKGVLEAKMQIECGNAFQIVLSREYEEKITTTPTEIYQTLRETSPTPFMYLYEHSDFKFVGASPERLIRVSNGLIETMPIAGTRGRGVIDDQILEKELLADPKENAEHMMLVDMGRNDVGSVSESGTVNVAELKNIRRFPKIIHLVSKVQGKLRAGLDALDALKASFPAGTLTGAPKIRAMEIIHSIEQNRRGLYGGTVLFLQGRMELDAFIAIRTATIKDNIATVRTGAGIVYDSVPAKELEETQHKARSMLEAIAKTEECYASHY